MQEYSIDVHNFDDIRPYTDEEVPAALARIMAEPVLYKILKYVYPGLGNSVIQKMMREIKTVDQFQSEVSGPAFKVIAQTTTAGLSFTNMESIDRNKAYVFLSNHRDIRGFPHFSNFPEWQPHAPVRLRKLPEDP